MNEIIMDLDYFSKTCSIFNLKEKAVTFIKNRRYLKYLFDFDKELYVIAPSSLIEVIPFYELSKSINFIFTDDNPGYLFTKAHNYINRPYNRKIDIISPKSYIHESAIIGVHGNTYYDSKDGERVKMKHMGNVVIKDNVDIEALSIVHCAGLDSTIVEKNVKVCVMCNVGHNCIVGENTVLAPGVKLGGCCTVGKNCYLWQNSVTKSHINICDNVVIGANSFVTKDITESGVYVGTPARYIKPYDKNLR